MNLKEQGNDPPPKDRRRRERSLNQGQILKGTRNADKRLKSEKTRREAIKKDGRNGHENTGHHDEFDTRWIRHAAEGTCIG